jgi:hypothetical protein
MIFDLLIRRFDHRIGMDNGLLGNEMIDFRGFTFVEKVFDFPIIFTTIVCDQIAKLNTRRAEVFFIDELDVLKSMLSPVFQ